jgi:hypothetical protein
MADTSGKASVTALTGLDTAVRAIRQENEAALTRALDSAFSLLDIDAEGARVLACPCSPSSCLVNVLSQP